MAELLPVSFPIPSESAIASYPYTDISEGSGTVKYVAFDSYQDAAQSTALTTNTSLWADTGFFETTAVGATAIDKDFDVVFNTPKTIQGNVFVNFVLAYYNTASTGNVDPTVTVRKWNGVTETDIVSVTPMGLVGISAAAFRRYCVKLVVPTTVFKRGESLRITVSVNRSSSGGTPYTALYFDPSDVDQGFHGVTVTTTQLNVYVPFKLDV